MIHPSLPHRLEAEKTTRFPGCPSLVLPAASQNPREPLGPLELDWQHNCQWLR
jgi:hypothetical protein